MSHIRAILSRTIITKLHFQWRLLRDCITNITNKTNKMRCTRCKKKQAIAYIDAKFVCERCFQRKVNENKNPGKPKKKSWIDKLLYFRK